MRRLYLLVVVFGLVCFAGCVQWSNDTSVGTVEGETPTVSDSLSRVTVQYLDGFTEAEEGREYEYDGAVRTVDEIIVGENASVNSDNKPHTYSIVNPTNKSFTVLVGVVGDSSDSMREYMLRSGEKVVVTVMPPGRERERAYGVFIVVKDGEDVMSKLRIVSPRESFTCNSKGVSVVIYDDGQVESSVWQTMVACQDNNTISNTTVTE